MKKIILILCFICAILQSCCIYRNYATAQSIISEINYYYSKEHGTVQVVIMENGDSIELYGPDWIPDSYVGRLFVYDIKYEEY